MAQHIGPDAKATLASWPFTCKCFDDSHSTDLHGQKQSAETYAENPCVFVRVPVGIKVRLASQCSAENTNLETAWSIKTLAAVFAFMSLVRFFIVGLSGHSALSYDLTSGCG